MKNRQVFISIGMVAVILLAGCNHPLSIIGEGDIESSSTARDCSLEEVIIGAEACTKNIVTGDYIETYTAVARAEWSFDRWFNACQAQLSNQCSFNISATIVDDYYGQTFPPLIAKFRRQTTGLNTLFIGHSFFMPIANGMSFHASNSGKTAHQQSGVFSGGATGAPEALWNNSSKRSQIQAALNTGTVELFGMTYHPDYPGLTGYTNWIDYALAQNSETRFFIGLPWQTSPGNYDAHVYHNGWINAHPGITHVLIDQLRALYPGIEIYCIPYGQAAGELYTRADDGELPDVSGVFGSGGTGIFTDGLGHADEILLDLAEYVWLYAIYGIRPVAYNHNDGYQSNLKLMADQIIREHDPHYDAK